MLRRVSRGGITYISIKNVHLEVGCKLWIAVAVKKRGGKEWNFGNQSPWRFLARCRCRVFDSDHAVPSNRKSEIADIILLSL